MQEDASCQRAAPWLWLETVPSGGPHWAGAPTPIETLPGARSGRLCVWTEVPLCPGKAVFVSECVGTASQVWAEF